MAGVGGCSPSWAVRSEFGEVLAYGVAGEGAPGSLVVVPVGVGVACSLPLLFAGWAACVGGEVGAGVPVPSEARPVHVPSRMFLGPPCLFTLDGRPPSTVPSRCLGYRSAESAVWFVLMNHDRSDRSAPGGPSFRKGRAFDRRFVEVVGVGDETLERPRHESLLLTERGACVTLPPVNENELRQVRMAVQWCALLLLVLTVMVGLVVFGVVTVDVGVAPG